MLVAHLAIVLGAGAMVVFEAPVGFLVVFMVLKSLLDLSGLFPDRGPRPQAPPAVKALGRRLPEKEGRSFSEHYEAGIEAELARSEANEQVRTQPQVST